MVQFALVPIATMLPQVSKDLEISIGQSGWIMSIYLLSLSALLLISGRLGDHFGHKKIFKIGVYVYLIFSVLAGFSANYTQIVLFRGLQGVGTALISGNSLSLVSKLFPDNSSGIRGRAFGQATSAAAIGSFIGIITSAIFLQYLSWRWIFWINIPMALYILFTINRIKEEKKQSNWRIIDFAGGTLLYVALISVVFYLSSFSGGHHGSHHTNSMGSSPLISYLLPVGIIFLFVVLYFIERKATSPIIILSKLKNKLFVTSLSTNFILHMVMINTTFFVPFLVEDALGLTPIYVGMVLISVEFMNAMFPRISGAIYDKTHSQWIRPIGMGIILLGFVIYLFVIGNSSFLPYLLLGGWIGIGMGVYWSVNNNIIMNSIKEDKYQGFASGMLETTRQLGHTFASALSAVLMSFAVFKVHSKGEPSSIASIFEGIENIILASIPLILLGFVLSLYKDKTAVNK